MKAVVYEAFSQPPKLANVPDPTPETHGVVVRVRATGVCRSDWHGWVGTRQGHHAAPRAGPRACRHRRSGRQGRPEMEAGRSRHGSLRLRLRRMPSVPGGTPAGLRPSVPARLHPLGLVRRIRLDPPRRSQPRRAARSPGVRHGGEPGLPVRHLLSRRRRSGQDERRAVGRGARLRRRRAFRDHDRQRDRRQCGRHRYFR